MKNVIQLYFVPGRPANFERSKSQEIEEIEEKLKNIEEHWRNGIETEEIYLISLLLIEGTEERWRTLRKRNTLGTEEIYEISGRTANFERSKCEEIPETEENSRNTEEIHLNTAENHVLLFCWEL